MTKLTKIAGCTLSTLVVFAAWTTARGETKTYSIDPVHSCVLFKIQHFHTLFTGRFNTFSGTITGDPENPASLRVETEVDILSIDTANKDREKHLLSPDFFDGQRFRTARFTSTRTVPGKDNTAQVTGNLTIRDITREVTFTVRFLGEGPDHQNGRRAGFHAETAINRKDFGVSYAGKLPSGVIVLQDTVELVLEIEAVETKASDASAKSLAETVADFKAAHPEELPPAVIAALAEAEKEIKAKGDVGGLKTGDRAPDFTLPDETGKQVSLSGALAKGPVVLMFFRGQWCSFCNLQMRAMEQVSAEIRKLGTSIIAISPETQDKSQLMREKQALSFPLLSDPTGDVLRKYRLLYAIPEKLKQVYRDKYHVDLEQYNGEGRWELPVTATYVIGADGAIKAGLVDFDYTKRMEPKDVLAALQALKK